MPRERRNEHGGRAGGEESHAVAVGVFDGVHRGHLAVLGYLRAVGDQLRVPTAVVTFDPHPLAVLRPESAPRLLSDVDERARLLRSTGLVDHVGVIRFDRRVAGQPAEDFVRTELVDGLGARAVVVGRDFRFGAGRAGDVALLEELGGCYGFTTLGVPLLAAGRGESRCSSTFVRRLVEAGRLEVAARLLGRPYELCGMAESVLPGADLPIQLPPGRCLPPHGRYYARLVDVIGRVHRATVSLSASDAVVARLPRSAAPPPPGRIRLAFGRFLGAPLDAALPA